MSPRVLFYVQHLLGVGHVMRAAALCSAMVRQGLVVEVAYGGLPVPGADFGAARILRLPPLRAADSGFSSLVDAQGSAVDTAYLHRRRDILVGRLGAFQPDIVLIETFPFGRRQMRFELAPLLRACIAFKPRPLVVSSIRDIVQRRPPQRVAETVAILKQSFDHVLVHGDPALLEFGKSFPAAAEIAGMLEYTGYVARQSASCTGGDEAEVLVSVGGGAVGAALVSCAASASKLIGEAGLRWRLLVGHGADAAVLDGLRQQGSARLTVERNRGDFPQLLRGCALSVSQAGYNTVAEVLAAGVRALLVPFEGSGETEQLQRAQTLAGRGRVVVLREHQLNPRTLAQAVDRALAGPLITTRVDLNGADASARMLAAWVRRG